MFKCQVALSVLLILRRVESSRPASLRHDDRLRTLQDDDTTASSPCSIPLEETLLPYTDAGDRIGSAPFRPSYINDCYSSLAINTTLMASHIENLRATYEQYFCFYDIANDVSLSEPLNFQAELGYTLFSGPLEGQCNIDAELRALQDTVKAEGASLATFWDIATKFNKLYDAHVQLPPNHGMGGMLTGLYFLSAIPERNLDVTTRMNVTRWTPSYNEEGELEVTLEFLGADGITTEEESIDTIFGMSPYDFYLSMVSKPETAINYPYQSIGARMNGAFKRFKATGLNAFRVGFGSRPTDILPDTFSVTYKSGKEETYYTGLIYRGMNTSTVYEYVNSMPNLTEPGSAFSNFAIAASEFQNINSRQEVKQLSPASWSVMDADEWQPKKPVAKAGQTEMYDFDYIINLPSNASNAINGSRNFGGVKIEDGYAVLKLEFFDIEPEDMWDIWSDFTSAAKERGVKKALIDISGNGGGFIHSGNILATSMYPFIPYETFKEQFDITYNDVMLAFEDEVFPVLNTLIQSITNTSDAELQVYLETLPTTTYDDLFATVSALFNFCCGAGFFCTDPRCQELADLGNSIVALGSNPTGAQLRMVLEDVAASVEQYNPFNVLGTLEDGDIRPSEVYPYNRGGQRGNLTNKFAVFAEELYNQTIANTVQQNFTFDEYLIVSDGTAGSTACIFSSMLIQLQKNGGGTFWGNTDIPVTPLATVTYGGTKDSADTTVAGFPASVQDVKIEFPLITSGLLYLMRILSPQELSETLTTVNDYYRSFLPIPPYFADGMPTMPVFNYYSYPMGPEAIPLQYVKLTAENHIQQIFNGNSLSDSSDLNSLYKQSARLGFSSGGNNTSENMDSLTSDLPVWEDSNDYSPGDGDVWG